MKPYLNTNRKCGPCSACCLTLGVPELDKKPGEDCKHRCNGWKACKIYPAPGEEDSRPPICGDYKCMWVEGHFANRDRPNEIGVIFSPSEIPDIGPTLVAHEIRQDAHKHGRAAAIIERLSRGMPVIVVPADNGNRRVICKKPDLVHKLRRTLGTHAREV